MHYISNDDQLFGDNIITDLNESLNAFHQDFQIVNFSQIN